MGIEELNFSSAVLQGNSFATLAELVADLAGQKDVNDVAGDVGLTYTEMQNLVKAFGFETMAKLGSQSKIDASSQFWWTLPLSEVKALNTPVVIGTDIVRDVGAAFGSNLPAGDEHFIQALAKGFLDISKAKVDPTDSHRVVDDLSNSLGAGYEFPAGLKLDAIDWFDLSAVVRAKNIRFDSRSAVTDISAIHSLFHKVDSNSTVDNAQCARSGDRLNDQNNAHVRDAAIVDTTVDYSTKSVTDASYNERDRDYLNFLNLFVPTPGYKEVADCGIPTVAPYLEAGLFKSNVGYGLNKEYLTTADSMKNVIRNNVRGTNSDQGAILRNEFQILKDYGFPKNKVYKAYDDELAYGVNANNGYETGTITNPLTAVVGSPEKQQTPEDIQTQFASVFGTAGNLSDQLSDFEILETFNDAQGGVRLEDVKAANDVKGWVQYIEKVKAFIASDLDHHWSESGIAFPINKAGSKRETWENFQEVLKLDPRLSHLPNLSLTPQQDERLRILLETIFNADASANTGELDTDLAFSSWTKNDMTLGIHFDLSDSATHIKDGKFFTTEGKENANVKSIWAAAVKHGWSDATEVYGNLQGSGIFMMDSVYNVRSRIQKLDRITDTELDAVARSNLSVENLRSELRKNKTDLLLDGSRYAYEYFTPGHFQDAFFDMTNLQHTANVALRYFDLDTSATIVDDVSRNIAHVDSVISYSLPLRAMNIVGPNVVPTGKYADIRQYSRIGWVYNELVRKSFNNTKAAVAEITSWSPVPPQLYVDVQDVTGYIAPGDRVTAAKAAGDYNYVAADGDYANRSLPGCMVHVMANFFAKDSAQGYNTPASDAELIALLDLYPEETIRAFNKMNANDDISAGTFATITNNAKNPNNRDLDSRSNADLMIVRMLQALVHYGKPTSMFSAIGANARLAIDAFEEEVVKWADQMDNNMGVFGDDAEVFSMVQHLGYWVPYLSQYTPEEIAEEAAKDDDIQNISDKARALMLGLLLAASRGGIASSRQGDAAARIRALVAFHNAGIPRTLIDIAFTSRGINVFANLAGSPYEQ